MSLCVTYGYDGFLASRTYGHSPSMKHTENGRILACIRCLHDLTVLTNGEKDLTWVTKHVITEWP